MDYIEQLLRDKKKHLELVNAIDLILVSNGYNISDTVAPIASNQSRGLNHKGKRFPKGGTYLEQIQFIFDEKNRFLHTQEIARIISDMENIKDLQWLRRRVSASLSKIKKDQDIEGLISYQFGKQTRDNVWGFKDWLDASGKIDPQYIYVDKESIS